MNFQRLADALITVSAFLIIVALLFHNEWAGNLTILAACVLTLISSIIGRRARSRNAFDPRSGGHGRTDPDRDPL